MNSCLYECSVMHHRLAPKEHHFRYRIFMFYLDLDELDEVGRRTRWFSRNRFNLYSFRDADHLHLSRSNRREEARAFKSEIRNSKSEIDQSLLASVATEGTHIPRTTKDNLIAWLAQQGVEFSGR